jgi:hypothetical protein
MDAVSSWTPIVFIVPCPSPLPWEHGRSRATLSGGIFSRRRRRGNKIGARGVPDSHSLKRHGRTRSCYATERSRLEERNSRTSCKRSRANSPFLPLMKRWLISITKLSSARRSRRTAGQKMPHKQPPSHLPYIAGPVKSGTDAALTAGTREKASTAGTAPSGPQSKPSALFSVVARIHVAFIDNRKTGMAAMGKASAPARVQAQGAVPVAIHRLLQHSVFGPDDIDRIVTAYEATLRALRADRADPAAETVAKTIMQIAQTGVRDPTRLRQLALKELAPSK